MSLNFTQAPNPGKLSLLMRIQRVHGGLTTKVTGY